MARGQDSLFTKNNVWFTGKIVNETNDSVKFKWKNIDVSYTFQIPKSVVYQLKYNNKTTVIIDGNSGMKFNYEPNPFKEYADFPLTADGNTYILGTKRMGNKRYKDFLESKNDSSINQLLLKIRREEKLHRNLLITFVGIEVSAALLSFVYVSSMALEGIGVVGVTPNPNVLILSCSITAFNLPNLFSSLVYKSHKNEHKREAAKIYNLNYFKNVYGSFD